MKSLILALTLLALATTSNLYACSPSDPNCGPNGGTHVTESEVTDLELC